MIASPPSARPRVCSHPPVSETYGPESLELAASAGLVADGWQADQVTVMSAVRPDGRWLCFEAAEIVSRQNGKGSIGEIRALSGLYLFGERLIMWTAHEYKTAIEAYRRIRALIEGTDDLAKRVHRFINTNGEEGVELNGEHGRLITGRQRLRFLARSKGSGRGFTGDCNIVDEAYAYTETHAAALMFTVAAVPNPQFLYLSSPPLEYDPALPLYRLKERGEAGGDPSLLWRDWGTTDDADLDDRQMWLATNPGAPHRITLEQIERERRSVSDEVFGRERCGIWPSPTGTGVIPLGLWRACRDPESRRDGVIAFALDVNPERSAGAIAVAGRRSDGLGHIEVAEHRPGTDWMVARLVEMVAKNPPCATVVDPSSPAGSLIADLEAAGIEVTKAGARDLAQACGALYDAVVAGQVRHIGQPVLDEAVAGARRRDLADAWAWARRTSAVDISPLVAVTLAAWGHATKGHQVADPLQNFW